MIDSELDYEQVIEEYNKLCVSGGDFLDKYVISSFDRSELRASYIMIQSDFRLFLIDSFLTKVDVEHLYLTVDNEIEYLMVTSLEVSPDCELTKDILLELVSFLQEIIEISIVYNQFEISGNVNKLMRLMIAENYHRININRKYD